VGDQGVFLSVDAEDGTAEHGDLIDVAEPIEAVHLFEQRTDDGEVLCDV